MTDIPANEHEQRQTISVDVFVPDHPDRTASPIFRATRKKLIEDAPNVRCWIDNEHCDHEHPVELHHFWAEWSDSGGIDWGKMRLLVPAFDWATFDPSHPETFIDSEHNAFMVLCKRHHTGLDHGIHLMPYPLWLMQKTKRADFVFSPDEEAVAVGALSAGS